MLNAALTATQLKFRCDIWFKKAGMLGPPHNSHGEKIGDCRAVLTQITGVTDRGTDICSKRPHTCDACNAVSEATERTNLRQFISHELNLTELDGLELVDPITQSRTGYTHSPASRHIDLLRTDCLQCRYSELGRIVREHCSWRDVNVPAGLRASTTRVGFGRRAAARRGVFAPALGVGEELVDEPAEVDDSLHDAAPVVVAHRARQVLVGHVGAAPASAPQRRHRARVDEPEDAVVRPHPLDDARAVLVVGEDLEQELPQLALTLTTTTTNHHAGRCMYTHSIQRRHFVAV